MTRLRLRRTGLKKASTRLSALALGALVSLGVLSFGAGSARADHHEEDEQRGSAVHGDGSPEHAASSHGHGHVPHFSDINWFTGLIGEKEGVEPSLLWRSPGTPVPLGALFINTAILFLLLGKFGGPAMSAGLRSRKEHLAGDIERAAAMKVEAEQQLAEYEGKLAEMSAEMARIKKELREQAERERERVLAEARQRAQEIADDARQSVAQELSEARQRAIQKAVEHSVQLARQALIEQLGPDDQLRLAEDVFTGLDAHFRAHEVRS